MPTNSGYSGRADSNTLVLELVARDLIWQETRYGVGIPEKVDQILKEFSELHCNPNFLSGQMRLELITQFMFSEDMIPLDIIPDCQQCVWDTEESLAERWEEIERKCSYDEKVTRSAKEVIYHAARKYHKREQEVVATPELVHEYCVDHKLPPELEDRMLAVALPSSSLGAHAR